MGIQVSQSLMEILIEILKKLGVDGPFLTSALKSVHYMSSQSETGQTLSFLSIVVSWH